MQCEIQRNGRKRPDEKVKGAKTSQSAFVKGCKRIRSGRAVSDIEFVRHEAIRTESASDALSLLNLKVSHVRIGKKGKTIALFWGCEVVLDKKCSHNPLCDLVKKSWKFETTGMGSCDTPCF